MNKNKAIRRLTLATVLIVQIVFLLLIAKRNYQTYNYFALLAFVIISGIILLAYRYLDLHHSTYDYEKLSIVIWVPIGAIACHILNVNYELGSVLSAGIIGTTVSFLPKLDKQSNYLKNLPAAIYCGVFVGMSSNTIIPSLSVVISAGMIAALFLLLSKNLFIGIGGKLGTMAFLGVCFVYLINLIA
ncbi:hypothetical protein [Maribacter ulvicola]|uniref:Uncharacterized protein n=1 Tax=Maribacter ulvicola TaxID=228959 RepID=A0A1N6U5H4_9FLAO|nr:hypothetical protein [Maribacter ulvicola]SIQ60892.1 hypothetical protein SAMN05421797_102211 [Maribacter ulvicola]